MKFIYPNQNEFIIIVLHHRFATSSFASMFCLIVLHHRFASPFCMHFCKHYRYSSQQSDNTLQGIERQHRFSTSLVLRSSLYVRKCSFTDPFCQKINCFNKSLTYVLYQQDNLLCCKWQNTSSDDKEMLNCHVYVHLVK